MKNGALLVSPVLVRSVWKGYHWLGYVLCQNTLHLQSTLLLSVFSAPQRCRYILLILAILRKRLPQMDVSAWGFVSLCFEVRRKTDTDFFSLFVFYYHYFFASKETVTLISVRSWNRPEVVCPAQLEEEHEYTAFLPRNNKSLFLLPLGLGPLCPIPEGSFVPAHKWWEFSGKPPGGCWSQPGKEVGPFEITGEIYVLSSAWRGSAQASFPVPGTCQPLAPDHRKSTTAVCGLWMHF